MHQQECCAFFWNCIAQAQPEFDDACGLLHTGTGCSRVSVRPEAQTNLR